MKIKKIYFNRMYDQWRGEPLYVEDGLDDNKLYIRIMDVPDYKEGAINTITAYYKDLNGGTYTILGQMDFDKRLAIFKIPLSILSNNGIYDVVFSLSFNAKDKEGLLLKTPIQTFEIVDTIETDDEAIAQDPHYPILVDLINQLAEYKVDTSIFPTREEMMKAIEENLNETSMEEILKEVQANGYITLDKLNTILINYASKSDLSGYAKESDLNKFVTNLKFIQELDKYVLKTSMGNYVLKEIGKGLSTHDLTDELYEKLVNLDINNGEVNIDLSDYQTRIDNTLTTTDKTIVGSINEIKNSIPIKTSQLQNDSGYLTEHQDLSDYATKSELHNHDNKNILDNVTQEKIDSWDNKSDFSGSYNDLTDKPIIPSINNTTISETEVYSSSKTEERLSKIEMNINSDITAVSDGVIEIDERVNYLEEKQLIIDAFDGTYDSLLNRPSIVSPNDVLTKNNTELYRPISRYNPATKEYVDDSVAIELLNLSLVVDNGNEIYSSNSFIDYLNEIAKHFISENIIDGDNLKYYHIFRGKLDPTNPNTKEKLPLAIEEKEYNNITYFSMLNHPYNILTTFIFANEGNLRIESPWTAQYDDSDMYSSITVTNIGTMYELIGAGGVATDNNVATDEEITQMLNDIFGGEK